MNIILRKSTVNFTPDPTPGVLVTIDLEWDPDYTPGYLIKSDNRIQTSAFTHSGVSIPYSCDGFDKIIVTNAAKQSALCQLSFFDAMDSAVGHDGVTVEGSSGTENIEVNIPQGAAYVRFSTNVDTADRLQAGRVVQMRGTVVSA